MKTKLFRISAAGTVPVYGEQVATFSFPINARVFRFVVLYLPHEGRYSLTHRESGMRVAGLPPPGAANTAANAVAYGKEAINALITKVGAARVCVVLESAPVLE